MKTLKKIIIVAAILCVLLLAVFVVNLILSNSGGGEVIDPPTVTDTEQQEHPDPQERTEPSLREYELPLVLGMALAFTADESLFTFDPFDTGYRLIYMFDEDIALEISFLEMDRSASAIAPGFLDDYFNFTGGEFVIDGLRQVGNASPIMGSYVSASRDGETYEAWIVDPRLDDFGFAIVINYRTEAQRDMLYSILDTMEIVEMYN